VRLYERLGMAGILTIQSLVVEGPGAVFTTGHGGHQTTWIMVVHRPEGVRYARVTERAGPSRWMWSDLGNARHRWALPTTSLRSALPGDTWLESFDAD
jgi:hypothetical protein